MASLSKTPMPATTVGPSPTKAVRFFTYVRRAVVGTAMVLQEAPVAVAVMSEVASLLEDVPIVGFVCKTFLAFEQLVGTAKSNKEDLVVLRDMCEVVITGVLDKRSDRSDLLKGFEALDKHVRKAKEVARQCNTNGRMKQFLLAGKICKEISAVRSDVLAFSTVNSLVLDNDINVSRCTTSRVSVLPAARACVCVLASHPFIISLLIGRRPNGGHTAARAQHKRLP